MNEQVRALEGQNGEIVVMGAWCRRCKQEAMPDKFGRCGFCETRIVDEDKLQARELLAAARALEEAGSVPVPQRTTPASSSAPPEGPKSRAGRPPTWWRENAVASVQAWAATHNGMPPTINQRDNSVPSEPTAKKLFGSWGEMIEAAGFARPVRGSTRRWLQVKDPSGEGAASGSGQDTDAVSADRAPDAQGPVLPEAPAPAPLPPTWQQIAAHLVAASEHLATAAQLWGAA